MRYVSVAFRHGVQLWGWKVWDTKNKCEYSNTLYCSREEAEHEAALLNDKEIPIDG